MLTIHINSFILVKLCHTKIWFPQELESGKPEEIMESTTDAAEWKLEVERVMPQLKVTIRTDNKVYLNVKEGCQMSGFPFWRKEREC